MVNLGFVRLMGVGDQWKEDFGHLLESQSRVGDLDLSCGSLLDGKVSFFKGHEKVLQERSGYCRYALELIGNEDSKPVIHFEKISAKNMQRVLNFLYIGHVEFEQDELDGFMESASEMGVTGIRLQKYACKLPMLNLMGQGQDKSDEEGKTDMEDYLDEAGESLDPTKYPGEVLMSRSLPSGDTILEEDDNSHGEEVDLDQV